LLRVKRAVLQFVIVKPWFSVLEIVLHKYNMCEDGVIYFSNGYVWISIVNNISVSTSLYGLVLFYVACEDRLKPYKPFYKFICVKAILFFSYCQTCMFVVLQMAGIFEHERGQEIYNLIICAEMVVAAIAQAIAFSYEPFVNVTCGKSNVLASIGHVLTVNDVFMDAHNTFINESTADSRDLVEET
jgi:hypothetical protein